jgi:inner membrane protein
MPTILGHVVGAVALGTAFESERWPRRAYVVGAVCSMLPDLDVIGLRLGVPYGSLFGHRGFSHSVLAAGVMGILAMLMCFRRKMWALPLASYLVLAMLSHGILDALTSGGMGVGFFAPFDNTRYFLPWRPIRVSPLALSRIFSTSFWAVLGSEMRWIVAPAAVFALLVFAIKRGISSDTNPQEGVKPPCS